MSPDFNGIGKPPEPKMEYTDPNPAWSEIGFSHRVIIVFDGAEEARKAAEKAVQEAIPTPAPAEALPTT